MKTQCSICTTPTLDFGSAEQLPGWSTVNIVERNRSVRDFVLCPTCTTAVRTLMTRLGERYRDSLTSDG